MQLVGVRILAHSTDSVILAACLDQRMNAAAQDIFGKMTAGSFPVKKAAET
jgi:hypothetical protein